MRILGLLLGFIWVVSAFAGSQAHVFVSFSMPEALLIETLTEGARLHIPATLNGLYHNSMSETAKKVMQLSSQVPNLSLQIDPIAFEHFEIHQVPALVLASGDCFDVIYGNLRLNDGLQRIHEKGECARRGAS